MQDGCKWKENVKTEEGKTDWIISALLHAANEYMNTGSSSNQGEKIEDVFVLTLV